MMFASDVFRCDFLHIPITVLYVPQRWIDLDKASEIYKIGFTSGSIPQQRSIRSVHPLLSILVDLGG
jgi:hypothetical protein